MLWTNNLLSSLYYESLTYFSFEERARYIQQISENHIERTTFEEFSNQVFHPCIRSDEPAFQHDEITLVRTFSLPSRPQAGSDPSAMLRIWDNTTDKSHRSRATSAVDKLMKESKYK